VGVLLSAYACEPGAGSEGGLGWTWAEALAQRNDVTLLTDAAFRPDVERARAEHGLDRMRTVYIDVTAHRPRLHPLLDVLPHHKAWQRRALAVARTLHAEEPFDVVHHVTYAAHRLPTRLWRVGAPFVWGPLGGGERVPLPLLSPRWLGTRLVARELMRDVWNRACRVDPRLRRASTNAAAVGVCTAETAAAYPPAAPTVVMAKTPVDRRELQQLAARPAAPGPTTGLSVALVGRLIGSKAPTLALRAFARYAERFPGAQLHVYGDGPLRPALEELTGALGVSHAVTFHGRVPRPDLLAVYADHQVLLFPSLHESLPMTVTEAMAAGLPVVCLAVGGVDPAVPADAGEKIRPGRPRQVVQDLASALERLTVDPAGWQSRSSAARRHALDPRANPTVEQMATQLYRAAGLELEMADAPLAAGGAA
jgi:glycosyltransferase involved in cell wall biosynthesis